ncbi:MAG TPA: methyltransferase domain-containing protein [Amycolatopsis sp.]|nr:methyltransferase domain-containing protein [Amycolatopsis sp.]
MATQRLRRRLVRQLIAEDALHDPRWIDAFRTVPRHVFLPRFFTRAGDRWAAFDRSDPGWLDRVYSRDVLVTQLDDDSSLWEQARTCGPIPGEPTSSSSMPAIMAIMLEELRVADGHRVLEIGTGTGYNAALLSHRCGSGAVSTIDIDGELVATARTHLRAAGYAPSTAVGDGTLGFPSGILFDRVICTAAVSSVPLAWLEQTLPGGHIVTTLNRPLGAGLVRLTAGRGPTAHGRVLSRDGRFMPLRGHRLPPPPPLPTPPDSAWRRTRLPLEMVVTPRMEFEFFASLELPGVRPVRDPAHSPAASTNAADDPAPASGANSDPGHPRPGFIALVAPDGSWARYRTQGATLEVAQGGPRALWDLTENAYLLWDSLGRPTRSAFGLTLAGPEQFFWLNDPDGRRWDLVP